MIIRFFRAIVYEGKEDEFQRLFLETLLPMMREQPGLVSASVGLPHESAPLEFSMIMHWRDMDSLKRFAGEEWQTAVIHPDEAHLLKETVVHHYVAAGE